MRFASSGAAASAMRRRVHALEEAMSRLEESVQEQSREVALLTAAQNSPARPAFVQNTATATVHQVRPAEDGRTLRGWRFRGPTCRAGRAESALAFRLLPDIDNIPGNMICERCLLIERAIAMNLIAYLSGDE